MKIPNVKDRCMNNRKTEQGTQWLSRGVEELFLSHAGRTATDEGNFDVVIVGSGYGGAIAAATLAGATTADGTPVKVCVLERGREYLPGSFPSGAAALAGHLRWSMPGAAGPQGKAEGLFDLRLGPDVNTLLANGLGGGSLINAGVMLQPDPGTITRLGIGSPDLQACFDDARALLDTPDTNTIERHPAHAAGTHPLKFHALEQLATTMPATRVSAVPISVAMADGPNSAGVTMDACIQCGDCATGCNHNAKLSLDTNLLVRARRQGAHLYTGATVQKLEPTSSGWCLHVVYTDQKLRRRHPSVFKLHAGKVILAAGSFGSTEILLRSRSDNLVLPGGVGRQFSSNGDMIAVAYDYPAHANAVADERVAPDARCVGPTITARLDTVGASGSRLCFEELAVPAALRRVFEELATTAAVIHRMDRIDWSIHAPDGADPCVVSARAIAHSSILAVMGDDGAGGEFELAGADAAQGGDGAVFVRWPGLRDHPLFDEQIAAIPAAKDGTVLPNPGWRALPKEMEQMITARRGAPTTVHPLGGCPMGAAVNQLGQVMFDMRRNTVAPAGTLVVLDGSIVPGALGVNPALTIAALSLRAARGLRTEWHWTAAKVPTAPPAPPPSVLQRQPTSLAAPAPTEIEVVERLSGEVTLRRRDGKLAGYVVELTMRYAKRDVAELALPRADDDVGLRRSQRVDPARSTVEVYERAAWRHWMKHREGRLVSRPAAVARARLAGRLDFMQREASGPWRRILRGGFAWLRNRGGRDLWQMLRTEWKSRSLFHRPQADRSRLAAARRWLHNLAAIASRAGEVRRFEYSLSVGEVLQASAEIDLTQHGAIGGHKRLTYGSLSNPLTQLSELTLTEFPSRHGSATLVLDTDFLVEENVPLLRIVGQHNLPAALLDLLGLGGFMARVLFSIHLWTFRKPDAPRSRTPQRLPGAVDGLPDPEVAEVLVDRLPDGAPVHARLTRYRRADTTQLPVVLIHGYSTSGTSFSHPLVLPNLASHLWRQGRDVWVLDLRTSSGMPYARRPWSFEDAALADIPAAIDHVCRASGAQQVDLMAHCMGGAMTGMAVLARLEPGERFYRERALLPGRIRRLVLSQVGPLVVFTRSNVWRAYLMNTVRSLLPRVDYRFRVEGESTAGDELLDRLLSALPYPRKELAIENSWWPFANTEFAGTRHRMDALYGRDFSLANMDRKVLDNLDDFFGPLNLETVSQAVHFARCKTITDRAGRNVFVSRDTLKKWTFPTLCIHGEDNGLSSVATLDRMASVLGDAGCQVETRVFPGFGHQDSWLGRDAIDVFEAVSGFLGQSDGAAPARAEAASGAGRKLLAQIPSAGPVWIGKAHFPAPDPRPQGDLFSLMCNPLLLGAKYVVCVPVRRDGERFIATPGLAWGYPGGHAGFDADGWTRLFRDPLWSGPDGTLVLVVCDDSPVQGDAARDADKMPSSLIATLRAEVERLLATTSAADLEAGVLGPPLAAPRQDDNLTFAVGSCQYPAGLLDRVPAYRSWDRLADLLDASPLAPRFVVLAGDQVYSDATAGLFDPAAPDDRYKRPYETLYASGPVRRVLRQRPAYMMLDDHEISDDWAPTHDQAGRDARREGSAGYRKYQRAHDLPGTAMWYQFEAGRLRFFMADTRSEREARSLHNIGTAKIMRDRQRLALLDFLRRPGGHKFVVTPCMLGLRRRDLVGPNAVARLRCDGWEGYPASMHELLATICLEGIENVVFLSGDEHISCDLTLTLSTKDGPAVSVRSIHASPLYAPYPFANSRREDFMPIPDRFSFAGVEAAGAAVDITCAVKGRFIEGDGFALLTLTPEGVLSAAFNREEPPAVSPRPEPSAWAGAPAPAAAPVISAVLPAIATLPVAEPVASFLKPTPAS